jgi:excisionase family DNA binding protein
MKEQQKLMTVSEFAAETRLALSTVRAWVLTRRVPFVKMGKRVLFRRSDVEALIASSLVPAKPRRVPKVQP